MEEIRLLSLWQIWASLMADGLKECETRSWDTKYRGLIAIQSAQRPPEHGEIKAILDAAKASGDGEAVARLRHFIKTYPGRSYPLGSIVCIGKLEACLKMVQVGGAQGTIGVRSVTPLERATGDWSEGRYAWKFEWMLKLREPIPFKGAQGLRVIRDTNVLLSLHNEISQQRSA